MIYWDKILAELIGVVGWRQSTSTGEVTVDATNLASSSGLYVQGAHPQVTVKNLKATQEDKAITDANMNTVLSSLVKDGISNVLNTVFSSNDIYQNDLLYKYESDFSKPITDKSGFVGFEINIGQRSDVVSVLNKIILQFNGAETVKLLLFNSGVKAPIISKSIAVTADTNVTAALDWVLGNITAPGGTYYLGYITGTASPYDRVFNFSNIMTCFSAISFKPIYIPGWTSETMFDVRNRVFTAEAYGMNLDVSTVQDHSSIILHNKDRFAKAIQLATAVQAIALMTTTGRVNPEERVIMSTLGQKVIIDSPATYNLYTSLEKELKSLKTLFDQRQITVGTIR